MQIQVRTENNIEAREGGRSSGDDKRCMLEAHPAGRAPVAVTNYAATLGEAFGGATDKLVSLLNSETGRLRDRKGGASIRGDQPG